MQTADSKGIARDALPAARGAKESGATHRETPVASRQWQGIRADGDRWPSPRRGIGSLKPPHRPLSHRI